MRADRCTSLLLLARKHGLDFELSRACPARQGKARRRCRLWQGVLVYQAGPNHWQKPDVSSAWQCRTEDPSYLSLSTAHQSRSSSCCSSCTGYHSGSQEALPLEVQSICFCRSQRYWSRGNLTGLCGTRNRATSVRLAAVGRAAQPRATQMSKTSATCSGEGKGTGRGEGLLEETTKKAPLLHPPKKEQISIRLLFWGRKGEKKRKQHAVIMSCKKNSPGFTSVTIKRSLAETIEVSKASFQELQLFLRSRPLFSETSDIFMAGWAVCIGKDCS